MKKIDKAAVVHVLKKALEAQFSVYSYDDMLNDCPLTKAEKNWAREHTYPEIKIEDPEFKDEGY